MNEPMPYEEWYKAVWVYQMSNDCWCHNRCKCGKDDPQWQYENYMEQFK